MGNGNGNGPVLRARLLAEGYRDDEIRQMCNRRGLVAVRRGAYVEPGDKRLTRPEDRHGLLVRAAVQQLGGGVVSHVSAAVLLGIAVWGVPLGRVHLTRDGRSGGRRSRQLHLHAAALDADEVEEVDGIAVTDAARTVADLTRTVAFEPVVSAVDSALHRGLTTVDAIAAALARPPRRIGTAAARRALAFADGRAESPGESRSRVRLWRAGLPRPRLQVPVFDGDGVALGRADFGWEEFGVVAEFDGKIKYGRLLRPGQDAGDVVFAEKVREDGVRDGGKRMVRWIWDELDPFDGVVRRVERAIGAPATLRAR